MRFGLSRRPQFDYRLRFEKATDLPVFAGAVTELEFNLGQEAADELRFMKTWRQLRPGAFNILYGNLPIMEQTATLLGDFALRTDKTVDSIINYNCAPHQDPGAVATEREEYGQNAGAMAQKIRDGLGRLAVINEDDLAQDFAKFLVLQGSGGEQ